MAGASEVSAEVDLVESAQARLVEERGEGALGKGGRGEEGRGEEQLGVVGAGLAGVGGGAGAGLLRV